MESLFFELSCKTDSVTRTFGSEHLEGGRSGTGLRTSCRLLEEHRKFDAKVAVLLQEPGTCSQASRALISPFEEEPGERRGIFRLGLNSYSSLLFSARSNVPRISEFPARSQSMYSRSQTSLQTTAYSKMLNGRHENEECHSITDKITF